MEGPRVVLLIFGCFCLLRLRSRYSAREVERTVALTLLFGSLDNSSS